MADPQEPVPNEPVSQRCPECGQQMDAGFVTATQAIRWAVNEKQGAFFGVAAETLKKGYWTNPRCAAHRCRQCQLVLFKY